MTAIDMMLMEMDQESKTTQRVLDRIPADKLAWKPHAKSMTLGQLGLHLAGGQGRLAEILSKDRHEVGDMSQKQPATKQEILDALSQGTASAASALKKLNDSHLMGTFTLAKGDRVLLSAPRGAVMRSIMLNHFYHHRGQLSVYLRLLDVPVPSIYGPSADENPFA